MSAALSALAEQRRARQDDMALPASSVDELAADYAAIYLTHALRASPHESVWRDDDHLMLQGPTFAVRAFYRRHGVQVPCCLNSSQLMVTCWWCCTLPSHQAFR